MDGNLTAMVWDRAAADGAVSDEAKLLVLAAMESDDAVAELLDTGSATPTMNRVAGTPTAAMAPPPVQPVQAYLTAITVAGFRGIGPSATLELSPGPGLTVVAGRNGCGKSSFAEALEVAMTRNSYRWQHVRRGPMWQGSWRNLHCGGTAKVEIGLAEEGRGRTTVAMHWAAGVGLDEGESWVQRRGQKREAGTDSLGWASDLELFRPFLSHDEMGALFGESIKLYAALHSILGLERLNDALGRLRSTAKALGEPKTAMAALAKGLKADLGASTDERAAAALKQIRKHRPDLDVVRSIATGSSTDDQGTLFRLRGLSELGVSECAEVELAAARYHRAQDAERATQASSASIATRRSDLLQQAIAVHEQDGDGPCAVCGVGHLDKAWADQARAEIRADHDAAQARAAATKELAAAGRALLELVTPVPTALLTVVDEQRVAGALPAARPAVEAWQAWSDLTSPELVADQGETVLNRLRSTLADLRSQADAEAQRRQDDWQPLAVRLADWLGHADRAEANRTNLATATAAFDWFKQHANEMRNDRLRPLADRAREIWALLRQESNVDLGEVALEGTGNHRRVELSATVDGVEAGALSVMSQGEMNALALSLFLPKATSPDSPFGFVVVDDPVQAMDPAKVDGLARVLAQTAVDRQVIVFTHDDRLPEAIRRLDIRARLLAVTRDVGSVVTITENESPAKRYLEDARAVASDRDLPGELRGRVIPELCRFAVEAECRDVHFGRRLRAGESRIDVEESWSKTRTTRRRVALAVHGDSDKDLASWQNKARHRSEALRVCGQAVHHGLDGGGAHAAIDAVEKLVADLAPLS